MSITLSRRPATLADLDALVELRVVAMQPSLEKLGRFNPARARQRLVDEYSPEHTTILVDNDQLIGCYALIPQDDFLYLAHLYLLPTYQGRGLGKMIVRELQAKANKMCKIICLTALNNSDAERFYGGLGFKVVERGEVDIRMEWRCPKTARV